MMDKIKEFIGKNLLNISAKILKLEEKKEYLEGPKFEKCLDKIRDLKNLEDELTWFESIYNVKKSGKYKIVTTPKEEI